MKSPARPSNALPWVTRSCFRATKVRLRRTCVNAEEWNDEKHIHSNPEGCPAIHFTKHQGSAHPSVFLERLSAIVSITTFGRNLRRSQRSTSRPDSRATEWTVPRLITEIQASSKMPCLRFINSTSLPYRLEISSRSSSLRSSYSGERTCLGSSSAGLQSSPKEQLR
jgi:hypothetical protein